MPNIMIDVPNPDLKGRKPAKKRKAPDTEPNPASTSVPTPSNADTPAAKKKKRHNKKKNQSPATLPLPRNHTIPEDNDLHAVEKDEEELALEDAVFGGGEERIRKVLDRAGREFEWSGVGREEKDVADDSDGGEALFSIDRDGEGRDEESSDEGDNSGFVIDTFGERDGREDSDHESLAEESPEKAAAWEDEDDVSVNIAETNRLKKLRKDYSEKVVTGRDYEERLRTQFQKLHPTPEWATKRSEDDEAIGGDLLSILRRTKSIIKKGRHAALNPDRLEVVRVKDGNQMDYSQATIQSLAFHPTAPVLMTAGYDKSLKLFQIDGRVNPKIQSLYLKDLPIGQATFAANGSQIYMSGKRPYFYSFDIESGKVDRINNIRGREENNLEKMVASPCGRYVVFGGQNGNIIVVSTVNRQWVATLKMNGTVRALDISRDGRFLFGFSDGEVYQWDMDSRTCVHRFADEGCVGARTLAVGDGFLATGSSAGIVNLYTTTQALSSPTPTPTKAIANLTTAISNLTFSPDSQILALASRTKKDALRLFHTPSGRVFKNWPTGQTPLGYVNGVAFSPGGGYVGIGNDKGKVLLYRLNAYEAF
ncbi:U3 snoRNP protein [Rhizophlyctis rosea]|nr:U3 snoRNP protein [Rhizophlyctis rosea]